MSRADATYQSAVCITSSSYHKKHPISQVKMLVLQWIHLSQPYPWGSMLECGTTYCNLSLTRVSHLLQQELTYQVVTTWQFWSPYLHPPAIAFPAPLTFCPRHLLLHPFLPPQTQGPQGWKFCRLSVNSSREPCATLIVMKGDFLAEGDWERRCLSRLGLWASFD